MGNFGSLATLNHQLPLSYNQISRNSYFRKKAFKGCFDFLQSVSVNLVQSLRAPVLTSH